MGREWCRHVGAHPAVVLAGVGWFDRSGDGDSGGVVGWSKIRMESWPAAVAVASVGENVREKNGKNRKIKKERLQG